MTVTSDESGGGATPPDSPETIHKGITLQVVVQIEGDRPAPEPFEAVATDAVKRIIARGARGERGKFTFNVVRTAPYDEDADAEEHMEHA